MNLEILETKFNIKYYNNLIKYCKKTNNDYSVFKKQLSKMNNLENSLTESEVVDTIKIPTQHLTDDSKDNSSEVHEIPEVHYSEDYLYKRTWTKLTSVHKIIKMKEFVNKLLINNEQDKDELKKKLVGMIKTKKLTKKDQVKYDSINGRVIAVPILKYKNGKYIVKSV